MADPDPNSPTRIDYGDELLTKTLQPGWTVEADGFGLLQGRCTFKMNLEKAIEVFGVSQFLRGDNHPYDESYPNLKLYKASYVTDKAGIATITAEYCGVDTYLHPDGFTNPQCAMVGSSASEDIAHHPNFIRTNCVSGGLENPLAGPPPLGTTPSGYGLNNALWQPVTSGVTSYQQFVGFAPSQTDDVDKINIKAGVRSYYKPSITVRVLLYIQKENETSTLTQALNLASYVGWVDSGYIFRLPEPYKKLALPPLSGYEGNFEYTTEYQNLIHRNFLITNCSVELFGTTCKVTADLMLSGISGWDKDIYPEVGDD
jgi:hypothetical protein